MSKNIEAVTAATAIQPLADSNHDPTEPLSSKQVSGQPALSRTATPSDASGDLGLAKDAHAGTGPIPSLHESGAALPDRGNPPIIGYAVLSLIFIVIAVVLLVYFQRNSTLEHGPVGGLVRYVILVVLGLCGAITVFGVMRSVARWRGKIFGGALEASGAFVGAAAVVIGGVLAPNPPPADFSVIVQPHGPEGPNDIIPKATVSLDLHEGSPREVDIDANGEARIAGISDRFRGRSVRVRVEAEGFQTAHQLAALRSGTSILVPMTREQPFRVVVRPHKVGYNSTPLPGCKVSIDLAKHGGSPLKGHTDINGEAVFTDISAKLRGRLVPVEARCPDLRMAYTGKLFSLTPDEHILVEMVGRRGRRREPFMVDIRPHGPGGCLTKIDGATVTLGLNPPVPVRAGSDGVAHFNIPGKYRGLEIGVRIDARGFKPHNGTILLNPDAERCLSLRPNKRKPKSDHPAKPSSDNSTSGNDPKSEPGEMPAVVTPKPSPSTTTKVFNAGKKSYRYLRSKF